MATKNFDIEEMKKVWSYDPATGFFIWKIRSAYCVKIGDRADHAPNKRGYRTVHFKKVHYQAHRVAFAFIHGRCPEGEIDHINGVRDDNRAVNIREATLRQNQQNRRKNKTSSSPYKGVNYRTQGNYTRWCASIHEDGKRQYLGSFSSAKEAAQAYDAAALRRGGEYALLNLTGV